MLNPKPYSCDQCGVDKQATNHWFAILSADRGWHIFTWAEAEHRGYLSLPTTKHACGRNCAHKILDQFMEAASAETSAR